MGTGVTGKIAGAVGKIATSVVGSVKKIQTEVKDKVKKSVTSAKPSGTSDEKLTKGKIDSKTVIDEYRDIETYDSFDDIPTGKLGKVKDSSWVFYKQKDGEKKSGKKVSSGEPDLRYDVEKLKKIAKETEAVEKSIPKGKQPKKFDLD